MSFASSNNFSENNQMAIIEELTKGQELAGQLRTLLKENSSSKDLVERVMSSISRALMVLDAEKRGRSKKTRKIQSAQTGGYRRSRSHPYSWTRKANTLNDGYSWRKYGQKVIQNAIFPRSYFRCTHKYDQNCGATRQAQQSEENPSLFVITYFGEHTCKDPIEATSSYSEQDCCIIDFSSNTKANVSQQQSVSLFKQECDEEVVSNNNLCSSSSEYMEFQELGDLERSTHSDVASMSNLGWEFIEDSLEFQDPLAFDYDELLK